MSVFLFVIAVLAFAAWAFRGAIFAALADWELKKL